MPLVIAIDGPAASGKSTVAHRVAEALHAHCLSTGDIYRALGWLLLHETGEVPDADVAKAACEILERTNLTLAPAGDAPDLAVVIDGSPVPPERLRDRETARAASLVASVPEVRRRLLDVQRNAVRFGDLVAEGRDVGTVVFPDAAWKFFLTATPEIRARRRLQQEGKAPTAGLVAAVAAEIAERDERDASRPVAPLRAAPDARVIDTSFLPVDAVVDQILKTVRGSNPDTES